MKQKQMNSKFQRPSNPHKRKPVIFLAVEGTCTEPQYFNAIQYWGKLGAFRFESVQKGGKPLKLLNSIQQKKNEMEENDRAWLVCDRDRESWSEEMLLQIQNWSNSDARNAFLFSNPSFDLWLLLHFRDWPSRLSQNHIEDFLGRYIPDFKKHKHIPANKITLKSLKDAIQRATGHPHKASELMNQAGTTVGEILKEFFD